MTCGSATCGSGGTGECIYEYKYRFVPTTCDNAEDTERSGETENIRVYGYGINLI